MARDLNMFESTNLRERKKSLETIWTQLSEEYTLSSLGYNELFSEMARSIFKRYSDPCEKIRDLSFRLTRLFFEVPVAFSSLTFLLHDGSQRATDFVPVLGYFMPALLQRIPSTLAYDQDLQVLFPSPLLRLLCRPSSDLLFPALRV
jgi:hypothetical protein